MDQNYKNHARYVPLFHFVTSSLILAGLIGSIVNLFQADAHTHYSAALIVVIFLVLASLFIFSRMFALKAQDRAIRAEENFRHYLLTGKPLDGRLRMSQITALRFASDAEFPALAQKAADEKLSGTVIKQSIQNWRPDYHRA